MEHSGHGTNADLPPFTLGRGLEFSADLFFLVGCVAVLVLYGYAVLRLGRRLAGQPGLLLRDRRAVCRADDVHQAE